MVHSREQEEEKAAEVMRDQCDSIAIGGHYIEFRQSGSTGVRG